jgi:hypothetical protein
MSDLLVALLPDVPGQKWPRRETAAELMAYGNRVLLVPDLPDESMRTDLDLAGAWVAHCALELARSADHAPVLLVAHGQAGRMLPALGFARRAARRKVAGYVLVDADLPRAGVQDWPDAPVTFVGREGAEQARLRGWDVENSSDTAAALRAVARRWG